MRNVVPIVSAMVLALATQPSAALEAHQKDAIERLVAASSSPKDIASSMARHYALLLWVEDFCNGRSSESVRGYLIDKAGIHKDAFEAGWMETFDLLAKTDPKAMCVLALEQYGPEGALIRSGWAPRSPEGR